MTQSAGSDGITEGFADVWRVPDAHVASGRIPGYVGAVRIGGRVATRAAGTTAVESDSPSMTEDTLFRIASITKLIGGALTLSLVEDSLVALDDPVARWLPEMATLRVLTDSRCHPRRDGRAAAAAHNSAPVELHVWLGRSARADSAPVRDDRARSVARSHPTTVLRRRVRAQDGRAAARVPARRGMALRQRDGCARRAPGRAAGTSLSELLHDRITGPLGMTCTGFGTADASRLATAYRPSANGLEILDLPDGAFVGAPVFEELSSGLVSTAGDLLRFLCAMADGGGPVLRRESVAQMTADTLTDEQRRHAAPIVGVGRRGDWPRLWTSKPRSRGWHPVGGVGTAARAPLPTSIRHANGGRPPHTAGDDESPRQLRRLLDCCRRSQLTARR